MNADWWARILASEPEALGVYLRTRRPMVRRVYRRVLGASPAAEDHADSLLVEVVFVAFPRAARHGVSAPDAYLYAAAFRGALKERRTALPLIEQRIGVDIDAESTPGRQLSADPREALVEIVMTCLGHLPAKMRDMLVMKYLSGATASGAMEADERIGRSLNVSKQYVGRMLRRSRELLRKCAEQELSSWKEQKPNSTTR